MKKFLLILIPVIILGVGVGLAMTGIINVPGLSPKAKSKAKSAQLYTEGKDPKVAASAPKKMEPIAPKKTTPPPAKVEVAALETKPEVGQKKLAKLWNELESTALQALTKDWKEPELASVLLKMDPTKVAELLTKVDAKRASNLSREMQKQASLVPRETGV